MEIEEANGAGVWVGLEHPDFQSGESLVRTGDAVSSNPAVPTSESRFGETFFVCTRFA